jgi:hypothetical protein
MDHKIKAKMFEKFYLSKRAYAQEEEDIISHFMKELRKNGYEKPGKEWLFHSHAYAFAQIAMIEKAMQDTEEYLVKDLKMPGASGLFAERFADLEKKKRIVLSKDMKGDVFRKVFWHKIGYAWDDVLLDIKKYIDRLPEIEQDAQEAKDEESSAA